MFDAEDIQNDLMRFYQDDQEINGAYEKLRRMHLDKGLPYVEPMLSKAYNTVRYLVKEFPNGVVYITDLDNGETYGYEDPPNIRVPKQLTDRERIQKWINRSLAA